MKTALTKRHHPEATRKTKRRPVRRAHPARHHKKHPSAAAAATTAVVTPVIVEESVTIEETPFFGVEPDKREEDLSDEEILDREERQDLY